MALSLLAVGIGLSLLLTTVVRNKMLVMRLGHLQLRHKTFRLREDLVRMSICGVITEDECARLYNSVNWAVRYIQEIPIFVLQGFARAFTEAGISDETKAFEKFIEDAPAELRQWYGDFSDVLVEAVDHFTPIAGTKRCLLVSRIPVLSHICLTPFSFWFAYTSAKLREHPLRNVEISHTRYSFQRDQLKEMSRQSEQVRERAEYVKGLVLSQAA